MDCTIRPTSGGSFGANSLTQHIGLGTATIDSLEVAWPVTKATQVFRDVPVDTFLEIQEGEPTLAVKTPRRVTFSAASGTHRH